MHVLSLVAVVTLAAMGCRDRAPTSEPAPAPSAAPSASGSATAGAPANVVQTEMRLLTEILEHTVRGIGVGDVRPIEQELHRLHEAKEATEAAVKSGAYKLPKNADQLETFEQMDAAFHEQLGALVKASAANDVPAAADALGAIVRGCPSCHAVFRP